jgi:hypothetical protein
VLMREVSEGEAMTRPRIPTPIPTMHARWGASLGSFSQPDAARTPTRDGDVVYFNTPSSPVSEWPCEAIVVGLARGLHDEELADLRSYDGRTWRFHDRARDIAESTRPGYWWPK